MEERKSEHEPRDPERHSILERLVKKGLESGIDAISRSEDTLRGLVENLKLPKETAGVVLEQLDETKKGLYSVVAKELRDFLQTTNFASDVKKILTGLAFEVKMEVRFKNAETDEGASTVRPEVNASASLKERERPKPAPPRRSRPPPPPEDPDDPGR
ncbi:MAG: hypothetical protein HY909_19235 [Deltaproteobacteria bacterium]|nr:hypothetical protein [Deltaproteobacteria bacterium]